MYEFTFTYCVYHCSCSHTHMVAERFRFDGDNLGDKLDNDSDSAKVIENIGKNKDEDFEH